MANEAISSLQNTGSVASASTLTRATTQTLDQDAFLKILVAQLQNQDPMQPLEDKEFISQMAQFSSLEQMQGLNQSFQYAQAFGLVGQSISTTVLNDSGNAEPIVGQVTRAFLKNGEAYLEVDGKQLPFNTELSVFLPEVPVSLIADQETADTASDTKAAYL
ncbi:MAG: flagellar hook capping FlgD N-terminal domain-containing protein [Eubacteriales bacterium]|nr:flagellar hook capping FlgD N-terminal domain-containing protein [Eubacteriales bacterium]